MSVASRILGEYGPPLQDSNLNVRPFDQPDVELRHVHILPDFPSRLFSAGRKYLYSIKLSFATALRRIAANTVFLISLPCPKNHVSLSLVVSIYAQGNWTLFATAGDFIAGTGLAACMHGAMELLPLKLESLLSWVGRRPLRASAMRHVNVRRDLILLWMMGARSPPACV